MKTRILGILLFVVEQNSWILGVILGKNARSIFHPLGRPLFLASPCFCCPPRTSPAYKDNGPVQVQEGFGGIPKDTDQTNIRDQGRLHLPGVLHYDRC